MADTTIFYDSSNYHITTWKHCDVQDGRRDKTWSWKSDFIRRSASSRTTERTFFIRETTIINSINQFTLHSLSKEIKSINRPGVAIRKLELLCNLYLCCSRDSPPIIKAVRIPIKFFVSSLTTSSIWIANSRFGTRMSVMRSVKVW